MWEIRRMPKGEHYLYLLCPECGTDFGKQFAPALGETSLEIACPQYEKGPGHGKIAVTITVEAEGAPEEAEAPAPVKKAAAKKK